jgi:hypothetical protein
MFSHPKFLEEPYYDVWVVAESADEARRVFKKETSGPEKAEDYKIKNLIRLNKSKVVDV